MREQTIAVHPFSRVSAALMEAALETRRLCVADEGDLVVVLVDSYLDEALEAFNRQAFRQGRPYLLVKPTGAMPWVGPLVRPGETACWACLAHRLRSNPRAEHLGRYGSDGAGHLTFPMPGLPTPMHTAFDRAALEVAQWCAGKATLENRLLSFEAEAPAPQSHRVMRRPHCPCCGQPPAPPRPLRLVSQKKCFLAEGGHRTVPPSETLCRYMPHVSPITGVVHTLSSLLPEHTGPVYTYGACYAVAAYVGEPPRKGIYKASCGKGKTALQARASALCEALERYCRAYQGDEHLCRSSYLALGEQAISPPAFLHFSAAQYENRETLNARSPDIATWVPEPFDETVEIAWTPAWSLTRQQFKYVPASYCFDRLPGPGRRFCYADSNGHAAGNTLEEAILQGFLELVERDSRALWWYNRAHVPAVDLNSFDEPYFCDLTAYYRSLHRDLWVLDLTSDLGLPVFAALSRRLDQPQENIFLGFGAHLDARLAAERALTELNQRLPTALAIKQHRAAPDDVFEGPALDWWNHATIQSQPYLMPHPERPLRIAADYPQPEHDDLRDEVMLCAHVVERIGLEMLVVDQTRPDIGLNVVKVIVPGLRHHWRRLGQGRLYDIPPTIGWLKEPLKQHQLNPLTMNI